MMKYSEIETTNFAGLINQTVCLVDLNQLVLKEGCIDTMPLFTSNEVVIDMDRVEGRIASQERRIPNKSMDSSFIIANKNAKEILLVEFRFNYINLRNLDKISLFGKVNGSRNALNNLPNIHNKYFFIFNSNLKEQAKRRFRNMVPCMPNNFIATDIRELKTIFF